MLIWSSAYFIPIFSSLGAMRLNSEFTARLHFMEAGHYLVEGAAIETESGLPTNWVSRMEVSPESIKVGFLRFDVK